MYEYVTLDISSGAYEEIRRKLEAGEYLTQYHRHKDESGEREQIDVHGVSLRAELPR